MVSALDSGSSGPGSSPGRGHRVVFLGKTLSLHPGGVEMGTGEFNVGDYQRRAFHWHTLFA